jgi:hypothetical protein
MAIGVAGFEWVEGKAADPKTGVLATGVLCRLGALGLIAGRQHSHRSFLSRLS